MSYTSCLSCRCGNTAYTIPLPLAPCSLARRQVIRQVHPDLFADSPYEKQCNSESLKVSRGKTMTVCSVD